MCINKKVDHYGISFILCWQSDVFRTASRPHNYTINKQRSSACSARQKLRKLRKCRRSSVRRDVVNDVTRNDLLRLRRQRQRQQLLQPTRTAKGATDVASRRLVEQRVEESVRTHEEQPTRTDAVPCRKDDVVVVEVRRDVGDVVW